MSTQREMTPMEKTRQELSELRTLELWQIAAKCWNKDKLIELLLTHGGLALKRELEDR